MFVVGYISGIAVAIILSLFYLGCAVKCVSGVSEQSGDETANLFVIRYDTNGQTSCLDCNAYFQNDDIISSKVPICDADEDFPLPKTCDRRTTIHVFKLFSRPPPRRV